MTKSTLLSGVGYVKDTIPYNIFAQLTEAASLARENAINVNRELAGAIKEEYSIVHSDFILGEFFDYIIELIGDYEQSFTTPISRDSFTYPLLKMGFAPRESLISTWINFQKKNEYNPPHSHFGAYSFVIWLSLPYDTKEEKKLYKSSTDFNFQFIQDGKIQQCPLDSSEGDIILFPADLWHSVQPFFLSDEFRVSISGNIFHPQQHIWNQQQ
tara:strand:+ start:104 stop:742 length:639 start_codon:yes stop_codon:yes gene_type:complete